MEQIAIAWEPVRNQYTVGELTDRINNLLTSEFSDVWVAGEISGAKLAPSGHWYFTLKDDQAQLKCACFRMNAMRLRVKPQDGLSILARGRLEVYPTRGEYQLIVEAIEAQGLGALQLAFEQLKRKLAAEGLFEASRKRPLPRYPRRVGIVTSLSGAAIQDMLNILRRRAPGLHIRVYPAMVQGEGSTQQVCRGIEFFSRSRWAEVIIAGRGGGSLEDLWTFNEEAVARAIAQSTVPVISAVGHETDITIADFVADLRAPTPSAAAEIVTRDLVSFPNQLDAEIRHLIKAARLVLAAARDRLGRQGIDRARMIVSLKINRGAQRIDEFDFCLRDEARRRLRLARKRLDESETRLRRRDLRLRLAEGKGRLRRLDDAMKAAIRKRLAQPRFEALCSALQQLSPMKVLDRGYAIVQTLDGSVVKQPPLANTDLRIRLAKGETRARTIPSDSSELLS